jgi:Uma2 family endonuclease
MSLRDFDKAEGREGWRYELSRGVITVMSIRWFPHIAIVEAFRKQLYAFEFGNPPHPLMIAGPGQCKLLIAAFESERHPDTTVYDKPPPIKKDDPWDIWVPEMMIEVVDDETRHADLVQKPKEYMSFGVTEYFAVDAAESRILVYSADAPNHPQKLTIGDQFPSRAVPGFVLDVEPVLAAANRRHDRSTSDDL